MKKILITSFGILMFSSAINATSIAQYTTNALFHNRPEFTGTYSEPGFNGDSITESPVIYIRTKAIRHFIKSFRQAQHVRWFVAVNGIIVHFTMNGIKSRAYYDTDGNWLYTIRTYMESTLAKDIRQLVKRTYYDYAITSIDEITNEERTAYVIQLEDKTALKIVSVCDDEMNVIKEYVKSK